MTKFSFILLTALSSTSFAAEKISFNEAIDLAVKNNLEVQASYEECKASQADQKSTRSAFFPKISTDLSYDKTKTETISPRSTLDFDQYNGGLNLSYNLFNGFSDYSNLKIAEANIRSMVDVEAPLVTYLSTPSYDSIISNTPVAKKFKATLDTATATVQNKKSGFYPSWDVNGSVEKTGIELFPNDAKILRIGTSLSWELFSGGRDFYSVNSAALIEKASEKRLENQNMEIRRSLVANYSTLLKSKKRSDISLEFIRPTRLQSFILSRH